MPLTVAKLNRQKAYVDEGTLNGMALRLPGSIKWDALNLPFGDTGTPADGHLQVFANGW